MQAPLLLLLALAATAASNSCSILPANERVGCWSYWETVLSPSQCEARGCCWDPSLDTLNWCYFPSANLANVSVVHVIQGCHLDVGFIHTAPDIVNLWFDEYFPLAFEVGAELDSWANSTARLKFTAQSWLVSLYVNCPPILGLHCPNASALAQFHDAVAKGYITWHAVPFNMQPEFMDASLMAFAVELTHELDQLLGVANKTVMSQRDVPGFSRSLIPILKSKGVTTISVGVNGGSTPPNVPTAFEWVDPVSGESVHALYLNGGYGGVSVFPGYWVPTIIPGLDHIMIVDWRGDNAGPPPTAWDVQNDFNEIQKIFPNATIISSTFDEFASYLDTVPPGVLPVISSEIGDTWMHGVPSDPRKSQQVHIALDARSDCMESGQCDASDERLFEFSRLLLKNGEHTWGLDCKTNLNNYRSNWSNAEFDVVRTTDPSYAFMEQSWVRQAQWGLGDALQLLADHPLAAVINASWTEAIPTVPNITGLKYLTAAELQSNPVFPAGRFQVGFDPASGALSNLLDTMTGTQWASFGNGSLGLLSYRTYSQENFTDFMIDYNYVWLAFFEDDLDDYDKVGIDAAGAVYRELNGTLQGLYYGVNNDSSTGTAVFHAVITFPDEVVALAGAPPVTYITTTISLAKNATEVNLAVRVFNKTATRLPEAMFLRFNPLFVAAAPPPLMEKLGEWMDPLDVVDGGAKHIHGLSRGGMSFPSVFGGGSLNVSSVDARTICWGAPTSFPTPTTTSPDLSQGGSVILWDNIWNTNYPLWIEGDFLFRFTLSVGE